MRVRLSMTREKTIFFLKFYLTTMVLLFLFCGACRQQKPSAAKVPLWGRFETSVQNKVQYTNPFADVTMEAVFTGPSGRKVQFIGFYDGVLESGEGIWKLRFMPDEVGSWSWQCSFSDGTAGDAGSFTCVAQQGRPGPLRKDPASGRWLLFPDGKRFYPRGYYLSELLTATSPQWMENLDRFFGGEYSYNLCTSVFWQGAGLARNHWNGLPYNGFHPIEKGDYTRLNLDSWRHIDEVFARMDSLEVVWFNFDGFVPNMGGEDIGSQRMDLDAQKIFIRNAVARLAPYWNITWNVAFEWWEFMSASQVEQLAAYIKSIDPWDHLLTVHDQSSPEAGSGNAVETGAELARLIPSLDFVTLQYDMGRCSNADSASKFLGRFSENWPLFAQEVCWESPEPYGDKLDGDEIRACGWGVVIGGGILNYAEHFQGPNGHVYGDGGGFTYLEIMFEFIESIPYWEMSPSNYLINPGIICLAKEGERFICYSQYGDNISLKLENTAGEFSAVWFDPRTGKQQDAGVFPGGGVRMFRCPDQRDWVLHVSRKI